MLGFVPSLTCGLCQIDRLRAQFMAHDTDCSGRLMHNDLIGIAAAKDAERKKKLELLEKRSKGLFARFKRCLSHH